MLSLRLIGGDKLARDLGERAFFDGKLATPQGSGSDRVLRTDASLTYRCAATTG